MWAEAVARYPLVHSSQHVDALPFLFPPSPSPQVACLDAAIRHVNDNKGRYRQSYKRLAKLIKRTDWKEGGHGLVKVTRDDGFHMWVCSVHSQSMRYKSYKVAAEEAEEEELVEKRAEPTLLKAACVHPLLSKPTRTPVYPLSPFMTVAPSARLSQRVANTYRRLGVTASGAVLGHHTAGASDSKAGDDEDSGDAANKVTFMNYSKQVRWQWCRLPGWLISWLFVYV